MKSVERFCIICTNTFLAPLKEVKRGNGKCCSKKCGRISATQLALSKPKPLNCECALCGLKFYKRQSSLTNSKSGLFFCCRTHKDMAQRIGGIEAIQPSHYGQSDGKHSYREIAFQELPNQCNRCDWKELPEVLEVHHRDRNRSNNVISNLEILCPNCHMIEHFLTKSGRYTP